MCLIFHHAVINIRGLQSYNRVIIASGVIIIKYNLLFLLSVAIIEPDYLYNINNTLEISADIRHVFNRYKFLIKSDDLVS